MKKFIMDYCLLHQMNTFGPKFFWFSCMGKKVPFWEFFRIFKNSDPDLSSVKGFKLSWQSTTFRTTIILKHTGRFDSTSQTASAWRTNSSQQTVSAQRTASAQQTASTPWTASASRTNCGGRRHREAGFVAAAPRLALISKNSFEALNTAYS